jgi:fructokinase
LGPNPQDRESMRIGIDLGGTKIELIALDGSQVHKQCRIPTPAHDYQAIVTAIAELVEQTEHELQARCSVGVGMPGALSRRTGDVKNANTLVLNGRPLDVDLGARLGRTVRVQNDANCFALSEAVDGAACDAEVVFGAILGTGTGGGIVVRKSSWLGCNAIAGGWGHNPLPWPDSHDEPRVACYCGQHGCLETYLSGSGLQRDHQQHTGQKHSAAEIARLAASNDAAALASIERYCERLARGLASVINLLDPDVIVLGGGLSLMPQLYRRVPALWQRHVFSDAVDTRLVAAQHGDSSGVRGAAWLWPDG